jgi:hypothetical protein
MLNEYFHITMTGRNIFIFLLFSLSLSFELIKILRVLIEDNNKIGLQEFEYLLHENRAMIREYVKIGDKVKY